MLRQGLQAVLLEAAQKPSILAPDSLIPRIAPRLYADTPWSMWQPENKASGINWVHLAILDSFKKRAISTPTSKIKPVPVKELAERFGLPQQTVLAAARDLEKTPLATLSREVPKEYKAFVREAKAKLSRLTSRSAQTKRSQAMNRAWAKAGTSRLRTGKTRRGVTLRGSRRAGDTVAARRMKAANARKSRLARLGRVKKGRQRKT